MAHFWALGRVPPRHRAGDCIGVAFGNLLQGVPFAPTPVHGGQYSGRSGTARNPFGLLAGVIKFACW